MAISVFFHDDQLGFAPKWEWAGEAIPHPESPERAVAIREALEANPDRFEISSPAPLDNGLLAAVHAPELTHLYSAAEELPTGVESHPTVFPRRDSGSLNSRDLRHAGGWCIDTATPLARETRKAALGSAASAVAAARTVALGESKLSYGLARPPGHHASRDLFGGYCYLNNAALATECLRHLGRVAIVDIDFHHGNGTQDLFYEDPTVLVVNIHGDPESNYPHVSGFAEETGVGRGRGYNLNLPLKDGTTGPAYLACVETTIVPTLKAFRPQALVLSAGLDAYHRDPLGTFGLDLGHFHDLGVLFGRLELPTVAVQEGGYYVTDLGQAALALLTGLDDGQRGPKRRQVKM